MPFFQDNLLWSGTCLGSNQLLQISYCVISTCVVKYNTKLWHKCIFPCKTYQIVKVPLATGVLNKLEYTPQEDNCILSRQNIPLWFLKCLFKFFYTSDGKRGFPTVVQSWPLGSGLIKLQSSFKLLIGTMCLIWMILTQWPYGSSEEIEIWSLRRENGTKFHQNSSQVSVDHEGW